MGKNNKVSIGKAITPENWIPCDTAIPPVNVWVFCSCQGNILTTLRLNEAGNWETVYPRTEFMPEFVKAWQALIKPYIDA